MSNNDKDVLEQNVSTLLESGGEAPRISDIARARIRTDLVAKHGREAAPVKVRARRPLIAASVGLAAIAATAMIVSHFAGHAPAHHESGNSLADGSTYITEPGAKVVVLGPRHVRVEGAALLDVVPGKGTFTVETARGRIEVLGTRFFVAAEAQRTTTAVVRGSVKLQTDQGAVTLHAGEQAVAEPGRPPVRGPAPRLSHLVSWAQEARRHAEGGLDEIHHGTLFARDPGVRPNGTFGQEYPLPMKQLTVDVVVEDQVARVALDQTFHNDTNRVLEGVYRFAIPPDAALQRFAMYVDGKLTESAVVERMRARRIYEELVYRRIDPGLLEYAGTGRLNLRVYPLPAQQDKRLMVAYTQSLPKLYSDYTLAIPLPEVEQPVTDMVVSARIKGCANCELSSPSHQIAVERSGEDAIVKYHRMAEKIGDTFVVHVRDPRKQTTVATQAEGSDHFMLVRAPADVGGAPREYRPRTWVILDDVSASRGQLELKAQQDLVDAFLREVDEEDKISVIAFDVEARQKLAPTRVLDVDRKAVRKSLAEEGGVGATDVDKALDAAMKTLAGTNPDDAFIVYLGDGVITSGARNLDALRARIAGKAHFVGVGVGDGPDTQTLDALAAVTGGFSTTIDLADDLGWRAFDLIAALHTSRVTGVSARLVDAQGQLVPSTAYLRSAQLADGEEVELVAKLAGDATPATVELTGTRNGAAWSQKIALGAPVAGDAGFLPRFWAQQHIAARLLAKHEPVVVPPCTATKDTTCPTEAQLREKRDEEIRQEVITLGKQYFLLSRHTSLLVLENDRMYAQYGIRKGSGDTWAAYAMPATIPVVTTATVALPSNVADDAELVRSPLQIFYNNPYGDSWDGDRDFAFAGEEAGIGGLGMIGMGNGQGFGARGAGRGGGGSSVPAATLNAEQGPTEHTRASLGLRVEPDTGGAETGAFDDLTGGDFNKRGRIMGKTADFKPVEKKAAIAMPRTSISSGELIGGVGSVSLRRAPGGSRYRMAPPAGIGSPMHFHYPTDQAFDDLTAFIPALLPDAADTWRAELTSTSAAGTSYPIDDAAKALLARARTSLPSGIYRWGDLEIAVDGARRFGWHRETNTGLGETASFDGHAWTRRYAELGVSVTRPIAEDDIALSLAYLPVLIAEPAHFTHYFTVKAKGAREIELKNGDHVSYVLAFDDRARLVAIHDGAGESLLDVTWGATGPTAAHADGAAIQVGFSAETIADATTWAHGSAQPGVTVELPQHLPAYWRALIDRDQAGSPTWRNAQRQLIVAAAAIQDRGMVFGAYEQLREHGGVERGDLALASGGIATSSTDAQLSVALAPVAKEPIARYLIAGRGYGKDPRPARMAPEIRDGQVGALWSLRYAAAQVATSTPAGAKGAVDELLSLGSRAFLLRLVGAAVISQHYEANVKDLARAWDSVATGDYKNIVAMQIAQILMSRGQYDEGAERIAKLASELDLDALPANFQVGQYQFTYSRRGEAGWQLAYATWRDRVLAGSSLDHLIALLPAANQHVGDTQRILARAIEVAGADRDRRLAIARIAISYNQGQMANDIIEPLLAASPTREIYQLAATQQLSMSHPDRALELLEKAEDAGADEEVDLQTVRNELTQIIGLCRQLALQGTGAYRAKYIARALAWGQRWRLIDPDNTEIDRTLGQIFLAVGDSDGAWRQLSSVIERDPWSGAGYASVAETFEKQGKVAEALDLWQQAIVIDQTNPTHRLRKAQALIALGRTAEGDALLQQITSQKWHEMWSSVVYQAQNLIDRGKAAKMQTK